MGRGVMLCFLCFALFVGAVDVLAAAGADPSILTGSDLPHFQQGRTSVDPRPRLSASQQAQILSDVQQHQQRYRRPQQQQQQQQQEPVNSRLATSFSPHVQLTSRYPQQSSTPFPSLAKYKVDRSKQQQLQHLIQQQQQVQQLLQQQQQKIAQQLNPNLLNFAQSQLQSNKQRNQIPQQFNGNQFQNTAYQDLQQDLSQPLFSEQQAVQLQTYLDKQREIELLQKQRQQLLLEQQELRRQQELLRVQQLQRLTSTTQAPTTTPAPTVGTTTTPILLSSPTARRITPSEAELFLKAIASHQKKFTTTTTTTTTRSTTARTTTPKPTRESKIPDNVLSLIQDQERQYAQQGKPKPQIKVIYQTDRPSVREGTGSRSRSSHSDSSSQLSERELLLKQLKIALSQTGEDDVARNVTTRDIILPNGKKVQVIQAPNDLSSALPTTASSSPVTVTRSVSASTTTIKPPKAILDELTKGVLPPGADFEVIRQKSDGKLEEVGKVPIQSLPSKKVTFVVLEEQPDGSYKVQGVKGNADKENGSDVESIVERIKKGELKLPPPSTSHSTTPTTLSSLGASTFGSSTFGSSTFGSSTFGSTSIDPNYIVTGKVPSSTQSNYPTTFRPTSVRSTTTSPIHESKSTADYFPYVTVSPNSVSSTDKYVTSASSVSGHVFNSVSPQSTTRSSTPDQESRVTTRYSTVTRNQFIPTMAPVNEIVTTTPTAVPTTFSHANTYVHFTSRVQPTETSPAPRSISSTLKSSSVGHENTVYQDIFERTTVSPTTVVPVTPKGLNNNESLTSLLKREGLFAMAKYLRMSGLDTVLNETGPYTIFVPTDKAFRTLLVQLGGPEKAEQKFHDNPRLLSGLLLHHVIPGAFRIDSLQDEMTGVSLAGTQLRVNEYSMHDHEWNDVKVTTINGARVAPNKRDIEIPQGIAHAVDRVMFPLPVGDLVQTLQADRERRFTTFLRILHVSGLEDTLSGPKTFTVFAPTDAAFNAATKNGSPIWSADDGADAAKTIVSRHIIPSTLYTAGMRYYLQKDTLRPQVPIHIHKNGGRVRINEAHVVTHNVPATNGVLHAIDGVL